MASVLGHLAILPLYWLFPEGLSLIGLIVGSFIIDLDSLPRAIMSWRKSQKLEVFKGRKRDPRLVYLTEWFTPGDLPLHNLFGAILLVPVGVGVSRWLETVFSVQHASLEVLILSVLVGTLSHLVLDLPAHAYLRYFTPFEKRKPAPFQVFKNVTLLKRIYPFREIENLIGKPEYSALPLFNYLVLSSLFPVITVGIVLIIRAL